MAGRPTRATHGRLIARLAATTDALAREALLRRPALRRPALVERLAEESTRLLRVDLHQAERLSQTACWLADQLDDRHCRARSQRAAGHVLALNGKYAEALVCYEAARDLFQQLAQPLDVAITMSGALQTLIYLGYYERAFQWAAAARTVFRRQGDRLRIARLDTNLANVLYRQDRFEEALALYRRAARMFRQHGDAQDVAIALRNMAVCYISLNDFARAEATYRKARAFCLRLGLHLLVAEADYNIAYLFYLRGRYTRAIALYDVARTHCEALGDPYHKALCDLDQSELYLELNLNEEGDRLAQAACAGFEALGMGYETAKALTNMAIASSHQGRTDQAIELFARAQSTFVREQNRVWPALIDVYQAFVLYHAGRLSEAERLCTQALRFFERSPLPNRTALCEILLARLRLLAGDLPSAETLCGVALERLAQAEAPALRYQAHFVLGQVHEAAGAVQAAAQAYQQARSQLEQLRSHLRSDELKIAFLKDKLAVYESLVWMCLSSGAGLQGREAAFQYIEEAKSRSLADLIAFRANALPNRSRDQNGSADRIQTLRETLHWCQREAEREEEREPSLRSAALRERARGHRADLVRELGRLAAGDEEFAALQGAATVDLERIRAAMPPAATLVEYYEVRGTLYVCILTQQQLELVPLAPLSGIRDLVRLLQFQLSKFRLGPVYVERFSSALQAATERHLLELYETLIAPVRRLLQTTSLIVVPHDVLHCVPFHALFDGARFLVDDFSISYAPSASVYALCSRKTARPGDRSLILGVPDASTPCIREEVQAVANALPGSRVFVGAKASADRLRAEGPASRYLHIATHGLFRRDNPMFSSIRLADSELSLYDLYHLNLSAELVTLSGCGTGLSVVVGADELLGLTRGLLYAGAQAVLVTLWDVNDQSTARFMTSFYGHLQTQPDKALALREAMIGLRRDYPHPYHWAPFVLVGRTGPPSSPPISFGALAHPHEVKGKDQASALGR